ncbi:MAG: hypothetical protein HQL65_09360 [Magnetococcales bacterium]|nr:hypothetical protein [Magnetococcales bacterium]
MSKFENQHPIHNNLQNQGDEQVDINSTLAQLMLHLVVILTLFFTIKVEQEKVKREDAQRLYSETKDTVPNSQSILKEKAEAIALARETLLDKAIEQVTREDSIHDEFKQFKDGYPKEPEIIMDKDTFSGITDFSKTRDAAERLKQKLTGDPKKYHLKLTELIKERFAQLVESGKEHVFLKGKDKNLKLISSLTKNDENKISKSVDLFIDDFRIKVKNVELIFISSWVNSEKVDQEFDDKMGPEFNPLFLKPKPIPEQHTPHESIPNVSNNKILGSRYRTATLKLLRDRLDDAGFPQVSSRDIWHYTP